MLRPVGQDYTRPVRQRVDALERDTLELMGRQGEGSSRTLASSPPLLVQKELARGTLVVACNCPLKGHRRYDLVQPDSPERLALAHLRAWLQDEAAASAPESS